MKRLRVGIMLVLVSWLPLAQLGIYIAHRHNLLTSSDASKEFRATVWLVQVVIGLIGVGLSGRVALDQAKKEGWKRTPALLWQLFWQGTPTNTPKT